MVSSSEPNAYVPVPFRHVPRIIQVLGELQEAESAQLKSQDGQDTIVQKEWSLGDLKRLLPLILHNKSALSVLDMTSKNPNQLVSFEDACASVGMSTAQGRSGMGSMTKLIRSRLNKTEWPISYHWAEGGKNLAYYKMSREIATLWQEVRGL